MNNITRWIAAGVTSLLLGGFGLVQASGSSIPGEMLYPVDKQIEGFQKQIATSSEHKLQLSQKLTKERLQELNELKEKQSQTTDQNEREKLSQLESDLLDDLDQESQNFAQNVNMAKNTGTADSNELSSQFSDISQLQNEVAGKYASESSEQSASSNQNIEKFNNSTRALETAGSASDSAPKFTTVETPTADADDNSTDSGNTDSDVGDNLETDDDSLDDNEDFGDPDPVTSDITPDFGMPDNKMRDGSSDQPANGIGGSTGNITDNSGDNPSANIDNRTSPEYLKDYLSNDSNLSDNGKDMVRDFQSELEKNPNMSGKEISDRAKRLYEGSIFSPIADYQSNAISGGVLKCPDDQPFWYQGMCRTKEEVKGMQELFIDMVHKVVQETQENPNDFRKHSSTLREYMQEKIENHIQSVREARQDESQDSGSSDNISIESPLLIPNNTGDDTGMDGGSSGGAMLGPGAGASGEAPEEGVGSGSVTDVIKNTAKEFILSL